MTYDTDGYGGLGGYHGGRLQDERAGRRDFEEEPSEDDAPESDGLEAESEELEDEGPEPMSPLAEDQVDDEEAEPENAYASAADSEEDEEELEGQPGVRSSGGGQEDVMTQSERRREFPTAREVSKASSARRSEEPKVTKRRGRKKAARA